MLAEIWLSVVLSGAPQTVSNHSVPTGSVSQPELYICCLDLLKLPSVQQRHKCFLPGRALRFASMKVIFLLCFISNISFSFLINVTKSRVSQMVLPAFWISNFFKQSSSLWSRSFSPHFAHLSRLLQASLWYLFLVFETPQ